MSDDRIHMQHSLLQILCSNIENQPTSLSLPLPISAILSQSAKKETIFQVSDSSFRGYFRFNEMLLHLSRCG
ncbi:hypothetical protein F511_06938 [Dorcoceras hygrometricum]|uniref:Uncharacterized protein n=1 Tax=Dorcoceras hygrometricum TaxID=472368 RepID=A0A2Z7CWK9_9LAMI|nr:hypothetical protein F511_06938 [Dorcoceras hygrometricum]